MNEHKRLLDENLRLREQIARLTRREDQLANELQGFYLLNGGPITRNPVTGRPELTPHPALHASPYNALLP